MHNLSLVSLDVGAELQRKQFSGHPLLWLLTVCALQVLRQCQINNDLLGSKKATDDKFVQMPEELVTVSQETDKGAAAWDGMQDDLEADCPILRKGWNSDEQVSGWGRVHLEKAFTELQAREDQYNIAVDRTAFTWVVEFKDEWLQGA